MAPVATMTIRERQDRYLRRNYGVGLAEYTAQLKWQRGRCGHCHRRTPGGGRRYFSAHRSEWIDLILLCRDCVEWVPLAIVATEARDDAADFAAEAVSAASLLKPDDLYSLAVDAVARSVFGRGSPDDGVLHGRWDDECRRVADAIFQSVGRGATQPQRPMGGMPSSSVTSSADPTASASPNGSSAVAM